MLTLHKIQEVLGDVFEAQIITLGAELAAEETITINRVVYTFQDAVFAGDNISLARGLDVAAFRLAHKLTVREGFFATAHDNTITVACTETLTILSDAHLTVAAVPADYAPKDLTTRMLAMEALVGNGYDMASITPLNVLVENALGIRVGSAEEVVLTAVANNATPGANEFKIGTTNRECAEFMLSALNAVPGVFATLAAVPATQINLRAPQILSLRDDNENEQFGVQTHLGTATITDLLAETTDLAQTLMQIVYTFPAILSGIEGRLTALEAPVG